MADKLVSEINFISCTMNAGDGTAGWSAPNKEHIEEIRVYLGTNVAANSLKLEYMGLRTEDPGTYIVRGVSVILPGSPTPIPCLFPGSSRSATVPNEGVAVAAVGTHAALSKGQYVTVRHIYHGGSGRRTPYNIFVWDYNGPDQATFADADSTALSVIDTAAMTLPDYYTLGVDNWIGLTPNLVGEVPSANNAEYKAVYLATHSFGNYNYDVCRADTVPTLGGDGGRYEGYTIFGRLFAKKGYCAVVDAVSGGSGGSQLDDAADAQRVRLFNYVKQGKLDGGVGIVHDHYWINTINSTGETVLTALGTPGGGAAFIGRVEHYWNTYGLETITSTCSPQSDSTDNYNTVVNQTEWAGFGHDGGSKNEWIDLVKWVRGVPLTVSTNVAAIGAGTIPARAADLPHLIGYFDLLNVLSPDGPNYVSKWFPATQEGVRQSSVTGGDLNNTSDGIHPGTHLARALQVQNPDIIAYSGSVATTIEGVSSILIEKGGSRPISLVVKDQTGTVMGGVNVTVSTSASGVVAIAGNDVTNGSGIALFDGVNAAVVPNSATVGATANLTFSAGAITKVIAVTVVAAGSLGAGGGGSLINGGLIG